MNLDDRLQAAVRLGLQGDAEGAFTAYQGLLDEAPLDAALGIAGLMYQMKSWDDCLDAIDGVLAVDPESLVARTLKALTLVRQNRPDESLQVANAVLAVDGDVGMAYLAQAQALMQTGAHQAAAQAAKEAIVRLPGVADPTATLGLALLASGQVEEGARQLAEALVIDPSTPLPYIALGTLTLTLGNLDLGIDILEGAGVLFSLEPEVVYLLCQHYARAQQGDDLRKGLDLLHAMVEHQPETDIAMAALEVLAQRNDKALALTQSALDAAPDPEMASQAWLQRGLALEADEQRTEALEAYRQAVDCDPEHFSASLNLIALLVTPMGAAPPPEHEVEEADTRLTTALTSRGPLPSLMYNRALLLHWQDEDGRALQVLERLIEDADTPEILQRNAGLMRAALMRGHQEPSGS